VQFSLDAAENYIESVLVISTGTNSSALCSTCSSVRLSPVNGLHPATDSQDTLSLLTISTRSILSRTLAEEDREFWRVVKLSESEKDSVCEDRGFEEMDALGEAVEERMLCVSCQPIRLAVISRLSNSELGCCHMFEVENTLSRLRLEEKSDV
jgi:hypothetical protein